MLLLRCSLIRAYTAQPDGLCHVFEGLVEPRDDGLRRARRFVEQVGQVPAELVLAERARYGEVGLAALAVRAEQERRPIALRALDHDEAAENVESVLRHY